MQEAYSNRKPMQAIDSKHCEIFMWYASFFGDIHPIDRNYLAMTLASQLSQRTR
jgi:hypothetical protein